MNITDVLIRPRGPREHPLMAWANVTLDGEFVVKGLKVIERTSGELFVAMPARKRADGSHADIAHPINPEARAQLHEAVLGAYHHLIEVMNCDEGRPDLDNEYMLKEVQE